MNEINNPEIKENFVPSIDVDTDGEGPDFQNYGYEVERFVAGQLRGLGCEVSIDDLFYDLKVTKNGITKLVEVKSSAFMMDHSGPGTGKRYARFDFSRPKNTKTQRTQNVDLCFVVRIGNQFEILGFLKARTLRLRRYISLFELMQRRTKYLEKWVEFHFDEGGEE